MQTGRPQRWGVIGGGLLGMTLALRLRQQAKDVTLFEAADDLGGLAGAWKLGDVVWDRHYHVILLSDAWLRRLLTELDLEQDIRWVGTRTGFYTDGRLHSLSDTWDFLRFPPLGIWDKLRLGATIFYASKVRDWRRLEAIPVADWLRRWSGRRTFVKIWEPLLRSKLGPNYSRASAAFIWAVIARMYAARRSGMKREMFGYVPGGYARILGRFRDLLDGNGVRTRLRHALRCASPAAGGGIRLLFQDGQAAHCDQVVLTVPAPVAARLCPTLTPDELARLEGVRYQGIVCASLLLKQPLSPFYITNITEPWVPFTAVIEMSALVDRAEFTGNALVYLPKYVEPDDPAFARSDQDLEAEFLDSLARMYPSFDRTDVLAFRVSRVRHVLAVSTLNYSANLPPLTTSVPGLHLVNSAHIVNGTLNVNETVRLAEEAVPRLLAASGTPGGALVRKAV